MSINKDSQTAPKLRFKGFTDDWEQRKLINVVDRVTRRNTNLQSKIPLTISAQFGLVDQITYFSKQVASKNMENYFLLYNGDFAYNKSYSKGYPFGAIKRLDSYDSGALSTLYIVFRPTIVDSNFLVHYFETTKWYAEIIKISAEGARNHGLLNITPSDFFDIKLFIPSKSGEQEKIGTLLNYVEKAITLHQRKLEQLNQLKEALLQQMFPGKGETVPKLRFAGFEGDWEELKLSAVVDKQIKGKAQADKLNPGNVEYLDTARLNGGEPLLTDGISNVMKDDILILWDGSKAGTVYIGFEGALGSTLKAYRTNSDSQFVFQYLKRYQEHIYNNYRTPNIPHVQKDFLEVFTIKVPTMKEQTKIGNTLKHLDTTITLQQRKLDQLKNTKQVLLENMFI